MIMSRIRIVTKPEYLATFFIYVGFFSVFRLSDATEIASDPIGNKAIRILSVLSAFVVCFVKILKRNIAINIRKPTVWPLALFLSSCILSLPFSLYPLLTAFKSFEILVILLIVLAAIDSVDSKPSAFLDFNIIFITFIICVILIEGILFPGLAWRSLRGSTPILNYMLAGVFPVINPNTVGLLGGLLATFAYPRLLMAQNKVWINRALFLIGLITLFFGYSRSAIFGFVVSFLVISVLIWKYVSLNLKAVTVAVLLLIFSSLLFIPSKFTLIETHLKRGQDVENIAEIAASRPNIWYSTWLHYSSSIFGDGYGAGFRYNDYTDWGHAHNSIFELLANVGVFGVIAWIVMVTRILWKLFQDIYTNNDKPVLETYVVFSVMVFLCVKSIAASVIVYLNYEFLIFASIIVYWEKHSIYHGLYQRSVFLQNSENIYSGSY